MARRFSRYRLAKKLAGGAGQPGSALARYDDYVEGRVKPEYKAREESSKPGPKTDHILESFINSGTDYVVPVSARVKTRGLGEQVTLALLGLKETTPALLETAIKNPNYEPAIARVSFKSKAGAKVPSEITGQRYFKPATSASYSFPFGKVGTDKFEARAKLIKSACKAKAGDSGAIGFSIKPESFSLADG